MYNCVSTSNKNSDKVHVEALITSRTVIRDRVRPFTHLKFEQSCEKY